MKNDVIDIIGAKYLGQFNIEITFSDNRLVVVNFEPFLEKSRNLEIRKYLKKELFKSYQIIDGNLDWNDFDLCFPVSDLYQGKIS